MALVKPGIAAKRLTSLPSRLLTQVALVANRLVNDGLAAIGARRYHYALLSTLAEFGPSSQASLGRRTGIDRSDIVSTMAELEGAGYVTRLNDPADRRRNLVTITNKGRKRLGELDRELDAIQDALLAPLTISQRERLILLLQKLYARHSEPVE